MQSRNIALLEMLSLLYEDMDVDTIEDRFVSLVADIFSFDRVGLFFVKHKKGVLQGKLCKGFEPGTISSLQIPITQENLFTRPLVSGFPVVAADVGDDSTVLEMGLTHYALIPVVNKKRVSCWQVKKCRAKDCPAFGNNWVRCWMVPDTRCVDGTVISEAEKMEFCEACPVYVSQSTDSVEGVMLVDNSLSKKIIDEETITLLSIIAHAVGNAINNSKTYTNVLRVAIRDELTGLHNRRYFNERLLDEIDRSKRYGNPLTLVMGDIDHFKKVNDTYGHPVGDIVLAWLGGLLSSKLRSSDVVARYGGEEFAILLINTTKEQAFDIVEGLRQTIEESTLPQEPFIKATSSFGIASIGEDATSFEGLVDKADKALYYAKAQGRNKVCLA
jgi:diguanylate cyclase (GGDEF)-like protein